VAGLTPGIRYSIEAGGINWNGLVNYTNPAPGSLYTAWVADEYGYAWPINNIETTPTLGTAVTGCPTRRHRDHAGRQYAWVADAYGKAWPIHNINNTLIWGRRSQDERSHCHRDHAGRNHRLGRDWGGKAWPINN